ncbi:MAG: hypothetical protein ACP5NV_03555 [Candidatus Woesearchaeota archaeon]
MNVMNATIDDAIELACKVELWKFSRGSYSKGILYENFQGELPNSDLGIGLIRRYMSKNKSDNNNECRDKYSLEVWYN